jgi:hypothetical protein
MTSRSSLDALKHREEQEMNNPRNYAAEGELKNIRIAEPHPAGPARRSERLYTETANDTPSVDPYRTEPPKKDRSGAMVRTAIFALLIGAGVVAWGSYAANRPEPVIAENSAALADTPIAVQPSAVLPAAAPEIAPAVEPAPAPRAAPARAERRAAPAAAPAATPAPIEPAPIAPDPSLQAAPAPTPAPAPAPAPTPVEPLSM